MTYQIEVRDSIDAKILLEAVVRELEVVEARITLLSGERKPVPMYTIQRQRTLMRYVQILAPIGGVSIDGQ